MTQTPRTLIALQEAFLLGLQQANSPATDFSRNSMLTALARAFAGLVLEQDLRLAQAGKTQDLLQARGSELDDLAEQRYGGLTRIPATPSVGQVLITSTTELTIPAGLLLTNLGTGLQYFVNEPTEVVVSPFISRPVQVEAVQPGTESNLDPGTRLVITDVPFLQSGTNPTSIDIRVGSSQKPDGTFCGALSQGRDEELDELFRQRILNQGRLQGQLDSTEALRQRLMQEALVDRLWARTVGGGRVEVLVYSTQLELPLLDRIKQLSESFLPLGTVVSVEQVEVQKLDLRLRVSPRPGETAPDLDNRLRLIIRTYLDSLQLAQPFVPSILKSLISPLVGQIEIQSPSTPVIPNRYAVVFLNTLELTYAQS